MKASSEWKQIYQMSTRSVHVFINKTILPENVGVEHTIPCKSCLSASSLQQLAAGGGRLGWKSYVLLVSGLWYILQKLVSFFISFYFHDEQGSGKTSFTLYQTFTWICINLVIFETHHGQLLTTNELWGPDVYPTLVYYHMASLSSQHHILINFID